MLDCIRFNDVSPTAVSLTVENSFGVVFDILFIDGFSLEALFWRVEGAKQLPKISCDDFDLNRYFEFIFQLSFVFALNIIKVYGVRLLN
jgi:hypothetical protein